MKKLLLYVCIITILLGCSNIKHNDNQSEESIDTATSATLISEREYSSEEIDSLANYAWGNIKFGASVAEVLSNEAFNGAERVKDEDGESYVHLYFDDFKLASQLGLKKFCEIKARFKDDQLYQIYIRSVGANPKNFFELQEDCQVLYEQFESKYGEPFEYCGGDLSSIDIKDNKPTTYAKWIIGDKIIEMSIVDEYASYDYTYDVYIWNTNYPIESVKTAAELKEEEKIKNEKAKAFKNAF